MKMNEMKLSNFIDVFKNKWMKGKQPYLRLVLFTFSKKKKVIFMKRLLSDSYLKINDRIYKSILDVLVKISLKLIPFLPTLSNFWENENFEILRE